MTRKLQNNTKRSTLVALATLTPREWDVLLLLAAGRNTGEIAEELYVTTKSVHNNKNRIGSKLRLKGYMALDQFAKGAQHRLFNWFKLIGKMSLKDRFCMIISLMDAEKYPRLFTPKKAVRPTIDFPI